MPAKRIKGQRHHIAHGDIHAAWLTGQGHGDRLPCPHERHLGKALGHQPIRRKSQIELKPKLIASIECAKVLA